jgi:ribosomal protein S18 acetylase RimI-like enzyme
MAVLIFYGVSMTIRDLTIADLDLLLAFYQGLPEAVTRFYLPFNPVNATVLNEHLAGGHITLGLFHDDRIVGHSFLLFLPGHHPIFGIGLDPSAQGQGWGRQLMQGVLERGDTRGLPVIELTVVKQNIRAIPLYESLGFRITGEATFQTEHDSWYMERSLEKT